jgi:hypothetical protein
MLSVVIGACLAFALALVVYAARALPSELAAQREMKKTAEQLNQAVANSTAGDAGLEGLADAAALNAATDFVKALATLGDSIGKLRSGTSALLLAFGILIFAGVAAGVDDKVPDATPAATGQPASQQ